MKVDVVLACSVEVCSLKGRGVQYKYHFQNLSVLNARKFYNFHTIVMSRCQTLDMLCTQDQVNSAKHKTYFRMSESEQFFPLDD